MSSNRYPRTMGWAASAILGLVAAGCGNVVAGGLVGEATVVVSGDADTLALAAQFSTRPTIATLPTLSSHEGESEVEGEVEARFLVFLITEGGASLQLGDEESRVRVDLRGRNEVRAVTELVPARRYTEFQLVFTEIRAEVEGLVIDGMLVPEVRVELEDLSLVVARPIDLDVTAGERVELVVDLNTAAWLGAVSPTGGVDQTVFQELVNVVVR
ncbi:MAG: hypothetical protein OEO79_00970 [Gemmatimonadota bacterium]|nr:hypothetical protein [Gemmatimonadota bacterium]